MAQTLFTQAADLSFIVKNETDSAFTLLTANFTTGVVESSVLPTRVCDILEERLSQTFSVLGVLNKAAFEDAFPRLVQSMIGVSILESGQSFRGVVNYSSAVATYRLTELPSTCHLLVVVAHSSGGPSVVAAGVAPGNAADDESGTTTAAEILYVETTGSDTNDGTLASPLLTIQAAIDRLKRLRRHYAQIVVGAGTFTAGATIGGFMFDGGENNSTDGVYLSITGTPIDATSANGVSGTLSAVSTGTAGTSMTVCAFGTLTDSTKTWTTDEFKGKFVEIMSGTGVGNFMPIVSNTATVLTIAGILTNFGTAPIAGSTYAIREQGTIVTGVITTPASSPFNASTSTSAVFNVGGNSGAAGRITFAKMKLAPTSGSAVRTWENNTHVQLRSCEVNLAPSGLCAVVRPELSGVHTIFGCVVNIANTSQRLAIFVNQGVAMLAVANCFVRGTASVGTLMSNAVDCIMTLSVSQFETVQTGFTSAQGTFQISGCRFLSCSTVGISLNGPNATPDVPTYLTFATACDFSSCGIGIQANHAGAIISGAGGVLGSSNTTAVQLTLGARMRTPTGTTVTGTTEVSIDGAATTWAAMRAASPKIIRDANYFTAIYE